jgi:hypothetical protein
LLARAADDRDVFLGNDGLLNDLKVIQALNQVDEVFLL